MGPGSRSDWQGPWSEGFGSKGHVAGDGFLHRDRCDTAQQRNQQLGLLFAQPIGSSHPVPRPRDHKHSDLHKGEVYPAIKQSRPRCACWPTGQGFEPLLIGVFRGRHWLAGAHFPYDTTASASAPRKSKRHLLDSSLHTVFRIQSAVH